MTIQREYCFKCNVQINILERGCRCENIDVADAEAVEEGCYADYAEARFKELFS